MAEYTLEQIDELPEEFLEVLYDDAIDEKYRSEIFPLLTEDQTVGLSQLLLDVYMQEIALPEFVERLKALLPDENTQKIVIPKALGYSFLPIADHLEGDVKKMIAENGGDPAAYVRRVPVSRVVREIRARAGVDVADDHLSRRLDKILESKALNARTDDQVRSLLTGPAKTSGVGLDEALAERIIKAGTEMAAALDARGSTVVPDDAFARESEEQETAPPGAEEEPTSEAEDAEEAEIQQDLQKAAQKGELPVNQLLDYIATGAEAPKPTEAPKDTFQTVTPADEKEIITLQQNAPQQAAAEGIQTAAAVLDGMVNEAVATSGVKMDNEDMERRYRNLLALYFRDLRDGLETQSKLTMPAASGGMGMTDQEAERVMSLLKVKNQEVHAALAARAEKEKQQFVESQAQKSQAEADKETARDTSDLDTRFAAMVEKTGIAPAKRPEIATPVAEKIGEPARLAPQMPAENLPKMIPVVSMDKPAPSRVEGKPAPQAAAPPNLPTGPAPAPLPPVIPAAPAPMPVMTPATPPAPQVQPAMQASQAAPEPAREVVSDVKFTPKLTGPVEELRALNLKDFRRLSKDPLEATLKIKDKIDLLEEQSFELKSLGIKAWQDSEPNRLYLDMLRASLEGKPVTDVIADLETKGQPVLSKAEFDAVMALNRQLRFS